MSKKTCKTILSRKNANDEIYTPPSIAKLMISMCDIKEGMTVLDPSKGGGIFYDNLPNGVIKEYCEIKESKDFFDYTKKVDLVIGNPPYSLWDKWIKHTMTLTDKFCYIFGVYNFTDKRVREILDMGYGVTKFHLLKIDWWFSPSYIVVFEKNKQSIITVEPKRINCENCNKRCMRGRAGHPPNICSELNK